MESPSWRKPNSTRRTPVFVFRFQPLTILNQPSLDRGVPLCPTPRPTISHIPLSPEDAVPARDGRRKALPATDPVRGVFAKRKMFNATSLVFLGIQFRILGVRCNSPGVGLHIYLHRYVRSTDRCWAPLRPPLQQPKLKVSKNTAIPGKTTARAWRAEHQENKGRRQPSPAAVYRPSTRIRHSQPDNVSQIPAAPQ